MVVTKIERKNLIQPFNDPLWVGITFGWSYRYKNPAGYPSGLSADHRNQPRLPQAHFEIS